MTLFGLLASVVGPTLGDWITDSYLWRWVFWINAPVGRRRSALQPAGFPRGPPVPRSPDDRCLPVSLPPRPLVSGMRPRREANLLPARRSGRPDRPEASCASRRPKG